MYANKVPGKDSDDTPLGSLEEKMSLGESAE